ncbi:MULTISPECIES: FAD-containing oxidoreductase [unclassified Pseudoxanthomonas]|jgi:pyruvate/2-oxoglutarate dehydrogenase complex dihydrolipoamide dehydrogenase (E3) component|uniref:FAD-containing oxidoreductase n=1 Tax=unclassified Pseudoxanthomonas TaxID=2645906 RepID=UPI003076F534
MTRRFDAIIIGAGQAGPALADRLTKSGKTVAMIERKWLGGTCVNTGCMPTKALVAIARVAHVARRAGEFGVRGVGPVSVDMTQVKARAATISGNARQNVTTWLDGMPGCTVIRGHARLEGNGMVRVGDETLAADWIFLNVGGRALVPELPGVHDIPYLTNTSILQLDTLPAHLVIIGGSYIGLEFAQMYRRFGTQVTVIEKGPALIGREDEDVSAAVRGILEAEGIHIHTHAREIGFAKAGDGITVRVDQNNIACSHVLLAVGRVPNTSDLGLERAGVATDSRGYIQVDGQLGTSAPGVWALGDCNGRGAFTHTAYNDYEIVAANLLDGESRSVDDRIAGYALYIDPPLGRVGMSEHQASASGKSVLVNKRPMTRVGRAVEKDETQGFMKVVADAKSGEILGAAILGTGGDEAIHGIIDMMSVGATVAQMTWAVPVHPTVSELIPTLLSGLHPVDA